MTMNDETLHSLDNPRQQLFDTDDGRLSLFDTFQLRARLFRRVSPVSSIFLPVMGKGGGEGEGG